MSIVDDVTSLVNAHVANNAGRSPLMLYLSAESRADLVKLADPADWREDAVDGQTYYRGMMVVPYPIRGPYARVSA